eukprot:16539-Heterococcus_DN1.PRE.2
MTRSTSTLAALQLCLLHCWAYYHAHTRGTEAMLLLSLHELRALQCESCSSKNVSDNTCSACCAGAAVGSWLKCQGLSDKLATVCFDER